MKIERYCHPPPGRAPSCGEVRPDPSAELAEELEIEGLDDEEMDEARSRTPSKNARFNWLNPRLSRSSGVQTGGFTNLFNYPISVCVLPFSFINSFSQPSYDLGFIPRYRIWVKSNSKWLIFKSLLHSSSWT